MGALDTGAEVRTIENGSDRKFVSPKFFKYFLETTFLHVLCYSDHYEPKIFFRFSSKYFFRIKIFKSQNILKVFLESTFVHVSCYPDHYEPKNIFSVFKVQTRGFPYNVRQCPLMTQKTRP